MSNKKTQSFETVFFLLFLSLLPAFMAHGNVTVITTKEYLVAVGDDITLFVNTSIYGCLSAA